MNLKELKPVYLLIILGLIIFLTPIILTLPAFNNLFDLSDKGEIGDTIGGITAPFINSIAAILVFIAFKEQVKSNDLIKEQLYFQHIQDQINRLEDNSLNLPDILRKIKDQIYLSIRECEDTIGYAPPYSIKISEQLLNQILYSTTIINQTLSMIEKTKGDKEFLYNKLRILYIIMYKDYYLNINEELNKALQHKVKSKLYIIEILLETKKLEDNKHLKINPTANKELS
jgi:hypothetical protein